MEKPKKRLAVMHRDPRSKMLHKSKTRKARLTRARLTRVVSQA